MSCLTPDASKQVCACCRKLRMCKMYTLQMGEAAWVCLECRGGRE